MKRYLFLFLLLTLMRTDPLPAQHKFYFTRLGVEDGLAQNTVSCILQDHLGFMWFGTKDGLNRYDGCRFRTFRKEAGNPYSVGSNFIRTLYEDPDGFIWVGTNAGLYLYDPRTDRFAPFDRQTSEGESVTGSVTDLRCDKAGRIWVCVNWQGLFRYDPSANELRLYAHEPTDASTISSVNPWSICFDADDNLWLGCHGGGLDRYDRERDCFVRYSLASGADIYKVVRDERGRLLIGTANDGIYAFDTRTAAIRPLIAEPGYEDLYVRDIFFRNNSEIWLGTESGIYIYNTLTEKVQHLAQEFTNAYSLSSNAVYSIYQDKEGALWVGTYFGGVNYLPAPSSVFEKYYPTGNPRSLSGKAVREFAEDGDGIIWVGTEDAGLNALDPSSDLFRHYDRKNSPLSYDNIHALYVDGDDLYVGTFNGGLNIMNRKTGKTVNFRKNRGASPISDNNVFSVCRDRQGVVWVGTIYGLNTFDRETGRFSTVGVLGDRPFVYDIYQGGDETVYFAAYNLGVFTYNHYLNRWDRIGDRSVPDDLLRHVISISEDAASNIWFGTEGRGLVRYVPSTGEIRAITTQDGLPNDVVYKVVEDNNRNLWVTTNKGLVRYDPITGEMKVFTSKDGLTSDQFNYKSGFRASDGKLYFGTINGFVSFYPDRFTVNSNISPVVFTGLSFSGGNQVVGVKDSPLRSAMPYTRSVRLRHDQSTFGVEFALLSYNASNRNRYRYIMRNYSSDWSELETNQTIRFYNVPPGKYTLEIMGANSDGIWNEYPALLDIEIVAPWYVSRLACVLYLLGLGLAVWIAVHRYVQRAKRRGERRLEELRIDRERADYRAKIDFFTNITHEIRTPLSLIKGPYEQIVKPQTDPDDYRENLEIMGANIERLLNLSNQLLDFRKMESMSYPIRLSVTDVKRLLEKCCLQFAQTIRYRRRTLKLTLPEYDVVALTDSESLTKIVCNLIDNAVKFASSRIFVSLVTSDGEQPHFSLLVSNDGEPVPEQYRTRIFEPFFQIRNNAQPGTGLGLPLVRHLVEQQGGRISVTTHEGLTLFRVDMPLTDPAEHPDAFALPGAERCTTEEAPEEIAEGAAAQSVLIVEDDRSMQRFLHNIFAGRYAVHLAGDAPEALALLDEYGIDIIVSDVLMPGMNGFEFCKLLKSRIDYCHIPVVMLSAKSDIESKVAGLDSGADAYIEKPFSCDYLLAQVATILSNLTMVKKTFSQQPLAGMNVMARGRADREFLESIGDIILRNLDDEQFNLDKFAEELKISRSSLHRKIKGLTRMTPNDLIRLVRLKKAAEMLLNSDFRVNEICYMVGFNSPSYFARCFLRQFGMLPKDFAKNRK